MSEFATEIIDLIRSMAESGDADRWPELQELGIVGIGTAEEAGGSGGSIGDLVVAIRELARAGIASPIVEASTALYAIGPAQHLDTVAFTGADLRLGTVTADLGEVPYADTAKRFAVVGVDDVAVVSAGPGVTVEASTDIGGAPMGRVRFDDASIERHDDGPRATAVTARLALARSAALLGSATAAFALTRSYVTEREQFGAALIAIPAVSAAVAQMAVRLRTTHSALDRAIMIVDAGAGDERVFAAAASARISAAELATHVARTAHQLHGAVGITSEYGLHHHTRRLWAWRDVDLAEREWSERLGALSTSADEVQMWDELTA